MAGTIVESAGRVAIPVERGARILGIEPSNNFSGRVHETIVTFAVHAIVSWHGPRWRMRLLENLERDVQGTVERHLDDPAALLWIREVMGKLDPLAFDKRRALALVIREYKEGLRNQLRARRTLEADFWIEVAKIVRDFGADLRLPNRDRGGIGHTPLYDFALWMRDRLVERGRAMLPQYQQDGRAERDAADRFARIKTLKPATIISGLVDAKRAIR
jgi:hypothetical protein